MLTDKKKKLYEEFQIRNNLKPNIDTANAFYCGYGNGYADSSEDAYSNSDALQELSRFRLERVRINENLFIKNEIIADIEKELETTKKLLDESVEVIEDLMYQHVGKDKNNDWIFTAISSNDSAEEFLNKLKDEKGE